MKANSDKSKQSDKATRRVLAGVLCGASVLSLVLSLVMPPISQAIANDAQTVSAEETVMGGGSSSESTDVENTNNGDTENQNSDDAEGGETGSSNGDEQAQTEDQLEDELQVEDGSSSNDDAVMAAAEGGQTKTAANEIASANDLANKLEAVEKNGIASFDLTTDVECGSTIQLDESGSNITLNLNGHKIKYTNQSQPLFNITGGATLTIKDLIKDSDLKDFDPEEASEKVSKVNELNNQGQNFNPNNYGKAAELVYNDDIPSSLTYYVTESSPSTADITKTTETLSKYSVNIYGAIVACNSRVSLIKLNGKDCTFNLQGGVLTQKNNCNVDGLIYAQNGSVNMSGGYVCGASMGSSGAGAGIHVEDSTLEISGGVIAGNYAPSGGGVYAKDSTVEMTDGIISGNGTNDYQSGYGAGICAENSSVTITKGYITNNNYQFYKDWVDSTKHLGNGCHGGGGIAAWNGGSLTIAGGYITGNYSAEAGGGVYAGAWNSALSGLTFSGGIIASNVAQNSEGGGIRIAAPTVGDFNVSGNKAYITNNTTNTTNDWGGGGVFVQGSSDQGIKSASLNIYNALITNNHANGFGGGFAACPTGKTAITDTNGIAIFGNSDGKPDGSGYNRSGGTHEKTDDKDENDGGEITDKFKNAGHQDLFLIRDSANAESLQYIAAVTGQMLGGGAANWSGTIDKTPTSIGKYEGAQAKYMIGLKSEPIKEDMDAATAAASLFITGNRSNIHGGGIMTNGDVVAGSTTRVSVYPKMKLSGTKELKSRNLKKNEFEFELLKQGSNLQAPSFNDKGVLQPNGCRVVDTAQNETNGSFTFDLGEVYADTNLVYYLVEKPGAEKDITYSKTIYKIEPTVTEDTSKSHDVLDIHYTYYKVDSVKITKTENGKASESTVHPTTNEDVVSIRLTNDATFTNEYTQYTSSGSWTPKATKVVKGGEMKEFTLEFADNENFDKPMTATTDPDGEITTTSSGDKSQTLSFVDEITYTLADLAKGTDPTGRGASNTFTYYVREQLPTTPFTNYTYDQSVYQITVNAVDDSNHKINISATYKQIQDRDGNPVTNDTPHDLTPKSTPTFTNTYSTSLPLSGMSGVTLTYLAGAAVLCAAAAWMHIRRKANATGGERRE